MSASTYIVAATPATATQCLLHSPGGSHFVFDACGEYFLHVALLEAVLLDMCHCVRVKDICDVITVLYQGSRASMHQDMQVYLVIGLAEGKTT